MRSQLSLIRYELLKRTKDRSIFRETEGLLNDIGEVETFSVLLYVNTRTVNVLNLSESSQDLLFFFRKTYTNLSLYRPTRREVTGSRWRGPWNTKCPHGPLSPQKVTVFDKRWIYYLSFTERSGFPSGSSVFPFFLWVPGRLRIPFSHLFLVVRVVLFLTGTITLYSPGTSRWPLPCVRDAPLSRIYPYDLVGVWTYITFSLDYVTSTV